MPRRFSDAERRRILREWARSGLSSQEFASIRGVSYATLYKWKREFGATGTGRGRGFVEVVAPRSEGTEADRSRVGADSGVELLVGRDVRITLARDFDPTTLRRAVETLSAPVRMDHEIVR